MAKCPKCGKENPGYVFYCGDCGTGIPEDLRKATLEKEKAEAADASAKAARSSTARPTLSSPPTYLPSGRRPAMTTCHACGSYYESDMSMCPVCGRSKRDPWSTDTYDRDGESTSSSASGNLVIGGILAVIAGILALGQGLLYVAGASAISYVSGSGVICLCGAIDVMFGLGSIAGGVFALKREHYMLAVVGAAVGMLGLGLVIGFILGLIALVLIASAKSEFMS